MTGPGDVIGHLPTLDLSCCCGGSIKYRGPRPDHEREAFDAAHAVCRARKASEAAQEDQPMQAVGTFRSPGQTPHYLGFTTPATDWRRA